MNSVQLATIVFGVLSVLGVILVGVTTFLRNSRPQRKQFNTLNNTRPLFVFSKKLHYLFCFLFATSTILLMTEINFAKKNNFADSLVEVLYQYLNFTEIVSVVFESLIVMMKNRRQSTTISQTTLFIALFGVPLLPQIAVFTDVSLRFRDMNLSSKTVKISQAFRNEVTIANSGFLSIKARNDFVLNSTVKNKTHLKESISISKNIANNTYVIDPLLLIRPQIATKPTLKPFIAKSKPTLKPFIAKSKPTLKPFIAKSKRTLKPFIAKSKPTLKPFIAKSKPTLKPFTVKSEPTADLTITRSENNELGVKHDKLNLTPPFYFTTWGTTSATCSFVFMSTFLIMIFITECFNYVCLRRLERNARLVTLEEWFSLVCRIYLGFATYIKWFALIFYYHSPPAIYSVFAIILSIPPTLYVNTNNLSYNSEKIRFKLGNLKKKRLCRNKRRTISKCYLTEDQLYSSETNFSEIMHQVQGPVCGHVTTSPEKELDVFLKTQFEHFAEDDFGNNNSFISNDQTDMPTHKDKTEFLKDTELTQTSPNLQLIPPIPSKNSSNGETRTSVFDDSDYDEVIDFMTSSTGGSGAVSTDCVNDTKVIDDNKDSENNEANSSKRTSASSVCTTSSSTSGVESGEEKTSASSKYSNLDIAKILHTKRRIHRILQTPPESAASPENRLSEEQIRQNPNGKKKSTYYSKRHTQYGTLGRRSKSNSSVRYSRPLSSGADDSLSNNLSPGNLANVASGASFRFKTKSEQKRNGSEAILNTEAEESRRWSRISSASCNSEKDPQSPQKTTWNVFKKFVHNNNQPKQLSHDEIKATIHLSHNSNWNNNASQDVSSSLSRDHLTSTVAYPKISDASSDSQFTSPDSQTRDPPPKRFTNSLMRRFSRKSTRSRSSSRRRSLPVDNVLGVHPVSGDLSRLPDPIQIQSPRKNSEQLDKFETKVFTSVQNRLEEEEKKKSDAKPRKSNSIRKRLLSFTRKRNSSQEQKTILKQNSNSCEADQKQILTKNLSCSSPQLSVLSVNSKQVVEQKCDF